ncbi:uncharacterized protein LOC133508064 [Syngnathoides biaculeatus]|uniref:uncharacterized protein LOC133508064 n=1 Tax=Syngnathoides biaculeatus TaxID=300417 RepID=UPI002ADE24D6|nr:uncharacterized protein LOC133508064 [Syngnathoides biaculeatus]
MEMKKSSFFTLMGVMMFVMETPGEELGSMWTTDSPPNLNGKMITLASNGRGGEGGVSFYPPYFSFDRNKAWADSTEAYPTRAYPTRAYWKWNYPTGAYWTKYYQTKASPTRAYPTRAYWKWNYPTGAYWTKYYQTKASPTRAYPTRAYWKWNYATGAYRTKYYQTKASPTRAYPIRRYWRRNYATRDYWARYYPTRAFPTRPYPTEAYPTTASPTAAYPTRDTTWSYSSSYATLSYPGWTTGATTVGVTVCLRYLLDRETSSSSIFTLSPSNPTAITLSLDYDGSYRVSWRSSYLSVRLKADVRMWPGIKDDLWTRLCLTVDTVRGVVQVFSGPYMSVRKMVPGKYVWSGEPVISMSGVDGQVTDLQMWDYPLTYNTILNYMTRPGYGWPTGSVLTWSNIRYSLTGRTLVEDTYERREATKSHKTKNGKKNKKKAKEGKGNHLNSFF